MPPSKPNSANLDPDASATCGALTPVAVVAPHLPYSILSSAECSAGQQSVPILNFLAYLRLAIEFKTPCTQVIVLMMRSETNDMNMTTMKILDLLAKANSKK